MSQFKCCPECGNLDLYKRQPSHMDLTDIDKTYHCFKCETDFDEPDFRERTKEINYSGLARKLFDADPDDL